MRNRITLAASSIVVLVIAASSFAVQPARAQNTAQAKADECLGKPNATTPKGSHWYYRVDRPTQRRCWYLGPANMKVRQAAPAERSPSPPSETPAVAQTPAESPAVVTTNANSVTATTFSASWPVAVSDSAGASDRAPTTAAGNDDAEEPAATATRDDMPLVWPVLAPADVAAAAQPSEPAPGLGHLLMFLAAASAFVAIAFRATLKLSSAWLGRSSRRPRLRPASHTVRPRTPVRLELDRTIRATREPDGFRPRDYAARWDSLARLPRTPSAPIYDDAPIYEDEAPVRRRRAVA